MTLARTIAALAATAVLTVLLAAIPASAATRKCSFQANATGIVVRNVSCTTGRHVINAYGQKFTTHPALGYHCRVVQLDYYSNPIVRCVKGSKVVLWHAV
jgi:hypothetical protein